MTSNGHLDPAPVAIKAEARRGGEVETRLCQPLFLTDAAELYRRFLSETT